MRIQNDVPAVLGDSGVPVSPRSSLRLEARRRHYHDEVRRPVAAAVTRCRLTDARRAGTPPRAASPTPCAVSTGSAS